MREDEQLYTKHVSPRGRTTYRPHSLVRDMCGLLPGHYRLWVRESFRRILFDTEPISPARAKVLAAIEEASEAMLTALHDANKVGRCRQLDEETERKGWEAFRKATGHDEPLTFDGISMQSVIDAGVDVLKEHMKP